MRTAATVKVTGIYSLPTSANCPFETEFTELQDINTGRKYLYSGKVFTNFYSDCRKAMGVIPADMTFPIDFKITKKGTRYDKIGWVKIHWEWR